LPRDLERTAPGAAVHAGPGDADRAGHSTLVPSCLLRRSAEDLRCPDHHRDPRDRSLHRLPALVPARPDCSRNQMTDTPIRHEAEVRLTGLLGKRAELVAAQLDAETPYSVAHVLQDVVLHPDRRRECDDYS